MASHTRAWLALVAAVAPTGASRAETRADAAAFVNEQCAGCHRFDGEPESKFRLQAPDLMWGGQKYQHTWLVGFLQGKEKSPYPGRYRWDQSGDVPSHPRLDADQAQAVADYFEKNLRDPRVKEHAFDASSVSEIEVEFGAELFREYSCIGCHQVMEDGEPEGGPISTHFFDAGRRYDPDWAFAFNLHPPSFTPHSGEYEADVTERKARWITGYLMTLGVDDFEYARPWEEPPFQDADPARGKELYRVYCAQCHGLTGKGDGPGAAGLEPRPAAHASMALDQLLKGYLYNVVFYGGKAVGKSSSMPDWGVTFSTQQVADVLVYLTTTFRGGGDAAATTAVCPQPRSTADAPPEARAVENPLEPSAARLEAGETLYRQTALPMACQLCHGEQGDGLGALAGGFTPRPRNFSCGETMRGIPDGQLFWIIRNGSPGTGMPGYQTLRDEQVWQLVLFVRSFAR